MLGLRRPVYQPTGRTPVSLGQALHRAVQVLALDGLAHELVVDPPPAVAHDLVTGLEDRARRLRVSLERHRDREHADRDVTLGEQAQEPPQPHAAAVLEHALGGEVAALHVGTPSRFGEGGLGEPVVVDVVLGALFVVHHEVHRDPGLARPARMRRIATVPDEIARKGSRHGPDHTPSRETPRLCRGATSVGGRHSSSWTARPECCIAATATARDAWRSRPANADCDPRDQPSVSPGLRTRTTQPATALAERLLARGLSNNGLQTNQKAGTVKAACDDMDIDAAGPHRIHHCLDGCTHLWRVPREVPNTVWRW